MKPLTDPGRIPPLWVTDEDLDRNTLRAFRQRCPTANIVRKQDANLGGIDDPGLLACAAAQGRVLLTHDRSTMSDHA